jgi:hypothetical protein
MSQRFWRFCHDSACVDLYQELGVYFHVFSQFKSLVCKCRFLHESRAQHVLARVGPCRKLSTYLHWLACIQSTVGIFTCCYVFRTLCVFACLCICCLLSAYGCTYWGLVMYLLVSASFKGSGCISIQWLVSAHTLYLHLLPCIKEMSMSLHFWLLSRAQYLSVFLSLYWELSVCLHVSQILRAWFVSAYVGGYHEHRMFQHVCLHVSSSRHVSACVSARIVSWTSRSWFSMLTYIGSRACICMRPHFSRAGVCMSQKAGSCYIEWLCV